jgi:uncharacterized membrane protein
MTFSTIVLIVTATTTGLIAGLFYAYSCSINLGLGRLPDGAYLAAMQSINKAILNPVFFASFMGTLILLPLCTYLQYRQPLSPKFIILLISTTLYLTGVFGVTIFGNVPLNESLARFDFSVASVEDISRERINFEKPWNRLHQIRTIASVVTLVLVITACVSEPNSIKQDY